MRSVVSCGSTSFPCLVFFFGALLWGSTIHNHTGRWVWQGSASVVSWNREKYSCHSKLFSTLSMLLLPVLSCCCCRTGLALRWLPSTPRLFQRHWPTRCIVSGCSLLTELCVYTIMMRSRCLLISLSEAFLLSVHPRWNSRDGLIVGRAPYSWSKVRIPAGEFSSPGLSLCADSYSMSVPPPQRHAKDLGHSAKSAGGRLHLNTHTPNQVGVGWLCRCPGIAWEPIRKRAHR